VEWIQQGFNLLKAHANFEMDYLLPKLSEDWAGFQPKYATYQDVASYSCHLRKRLTSYYDFNAVIPEDLSSFWTEYSERAILPTALAMLGVSCGSLETRSRRHIHQILQWIGGTVAGQVREGFAESRTGLGF
jgi:hypothetical protein